MISTRSTASGMHAQAYGIHDNRLHPEHLVQIQHTMRSASSVCTWAMQVDEEVDEEFEKELAALMTDFKLPPSGPFPQAAASMGLADEQAPADPGSTVSFRVMMKRGGRDDRSKAVQVCLA